jgi:hypothetical protein
MQSLDGSRCSCCVGFWVRGGEREELEAIVPRGRAVDSWRDARPAVRLTVRAPLTYDAARRHFILGQLIVLKIFDLEGSHQELEWSSRLGSEVGLLRFKRIRGTWKRGKDDNFTERIPMKVI